MKLKLPDQLTYLIESGVWPTSTNSQNFSPLLKRKAARKLSPDDDRIILMPPPFFTISDYIRGGNGDFWLTDVTNPVEIDYTQALIIGDFGIGSDSAIILYYATGEEPKVMYLRWKFDGSTVQHSWVQTHATFAEFASDVGLI